MFSLLVQNVDSEGVAGGHGGHGTPLPMVNACPYMRDEGYNKCQDRTKSAKWFLETITRGAFEVVRPDELDSGLVADYAALHALWAEETSAPNCSAAITGRARDPQRAARGCQRKLARHMAAGGRAANGWPDVDQQIEEWAGKRKTKASKLARKPRPPKPLAGPGRALGAATACSEPASVRCPEAEAGPVPRGRGY